MNDLAPPNDLASSSDVEYLSEPAAFYRRPLAAAIFIWLALAWLALTGVAAYWLGGLAAVAFVLVWLIPAVTLAWMATRERPASFWHGLLLAFLLVAASLGTSALLAFALNQGFLQPRIASLTIDRAAEALASDPRFRRVEFSPSEKGSIRVRGEVRSAESLFALRELLQDLEPPMHLPEFEIRDVIASPKDGTKPANKNPPNGNAADTNPPQGTDPSSPAG